MKFDIPKTEFDPHPAGQHTGRIVEVQDRGLQDTSYGQKYKLVIVVESDTAYQGDGAPFALWVWVTLSAGRKATLTRLREKLLGRPLTEDERLHFDADGEMVSRRINYFVEHNYGDAGQTYANLVTWAPVEQGQRAKAAREPLAGSGHGQHPGAAVAEAVPERTETVAPFGRPPPPPAAVGYGDDLPF